MSAILKALRKLETEANSNRPWSPYIRPEVGGRRFSGIKLFKIILSIGLLAFGMGFIYFQISPNSFHLARSMFVTALTDLKSIPPIQPTQKVKMNSKSKDMAIPIDTENARNKPAPIQSPTKPNDNPSTPLSQADHKQSPEQTAKTQFDNPAINEMRKSKNVPGKSDASKSVSPSSASEPAENSMVIRQLKKEKDPTDTLPDDTTLALQAIAWASDPGQRIAVINGQITKEGDTIDGYKVGRIEEDAVTVYKGEKAAKLKFRAK